MTTTTQPDLGFAPNEDPFVVAHGGFYRRWLSMLDDIDELKGAVARLEGTTEDKWVPVWEEMGLDRDTLFHLGKHPAIEGQFHMTVCALRLSARVNGVSRRHGQVSRTLWRDLWPGRRWEAVPIGHVTNGVHLATWMATPIMELLDEHLVAVQGAPPEPAIDLLPCRQSHADARRRRCEAGWFGDTGRLQPQRKRDGLLSLARHEGAAPWDRKSRLGKHEPGQHLVATQYSRREAVEIVVDARHSDQRGVLVLDAQELVVEEAAPEAQPLRRLGEQRIDHARFERRRVDSRRERALIDPASNFAQHFAAEPARVLEPARP